MKIEIKGQENGNVRLLTFTDLKIGDVFTRKKDENIVVFLKVSAFYGYNFESEELCYFCTNQSSMSKFSGYWSNDLVTKYVDTTFVLDGPVAFCEKEEVTIV